MINFIKKVISKKGSSVEAMLENVKVHSCSGSGSGTGIACTSRA